MTPVLLSALFEESGPAELAGLAVELGFAGIDLAVHGGSVAEAERMLAGLAAAGLSARLLSLDAAAAGHLATWLALADAHGLEAVRLAPLAAEPAALAAQLAGLAPPGPMVLVPHHPGTPLADLAALGQLLDAVDSPRVAAALAPDLLARSRAGDHAAWLERLPIPRLGALVLAGYRWDSEIGSGNLRLWSARAASLLHGLTPWSEWLARLAATSFDGLFTFGDAGLSGTLADRLRTARDDLRVVRRLWRRDEAGQATST